MRLFLPSLPLLLAGAFAAAATAAPPLAEKRLSAANAADEPVIAAPAPAADPDTVAAVERVLRALNFPGMLLEVLHAQSDRGQFDPQMRAFHQAMFERHFDENELVRQVAAAMAPQVDPDDLARLRAFVDSREGRVFAAALRGRPSGELARIGEGLPDDVRAVWEPLKGDGGFRGFWDAIQSREFDAAYAGYMQTLLCTVARREFAAEADTLAGSECAALDALRVRGAAPAIAGSPPSRLIPVWRRRGECRHEPGQRCVEWLLRADPTLRLVLIDSSGSVRASLERRADDGRYRSLLLLLPVATGADGVDRPLPWTEIVDLAPVAGDAFAAAGFAHALDPDPGHVICSPDGQQRIPAVRFVGVTGRVEDGAAPAVDDLRPMTLDELQDGAAAAPVAGQAAASVAGCSGFEEHRRLRPARIG